jgi:drug/metabolite transporter (DMT)-like permease
VVDAPLAPSAEEPAAVPHPLGYALVIGAVVLWSANAVVAKVVLGSGELSALRLSEVRGRGLGEELSGQQIGGGLMVLGAVALAQTARPHPPDV